MADTLTNHFHWIKPEISGSPTTWGVKLNADLDQIDSLVFTNQGAAATAQAAAVAAQATANAAVPLAGGTMTGPLVAPKITVTSAPVSPNDAVRLMDLPTAASPVLVPIGGIVMWPSTSAPPTGWLLCNGAAYSTATYPALATALSTYTGVPAGTLPNFTGVSPHGPDPSNPFASVIGDDFEVTLNLGSDYGFLIINFIIRAA